MVAIAARGIEIGFGKGEARTQVLRGVDFTAEAGELTFLIGPSGCGKTTLISILAAMLQAEKGEVELFGTRLRGLRGEARPARTGLGKLIRARPGHWWLRGIRGSSLRSVDADARGGMRG